MIYMFQSTRPWGARPCGSEHKIMPIYVSIHAPVGGATDSSSIVAAVRSFQSTRPWGARLYHLKPFYYTFQSLFSANLPNIRKKIYLNNQQKQNLIE